MENVSGRWGIAVTVKLDNVMISYLVGLPNYCCGSEMRQDNRTVAGIALTVIASVTSRIVYTTFSE